MNCLSPMSIKRPGFDAFGHAHAANDRITVPCGKCAACLSNQRSDWTFRLKEELKKAKSAYFITLTYNEDHVPYVNNETATLRKRDLQLFIKRLRRFHDMEVEKYQKYVNGRYVEFKPPILRYYAIGEYGPETLRPHYHGLFFNISEDAVSHLDEIWNLGFIKVGDVNTASIHYVTKYVINRKQDIEGVERPFSIMSRRPGIGFGYINNDNVRYHRQSKGQKFQVTNEGGIVQRMPRYYKQFIFTKNEMESNKKLLETKMDSRFDEDLEELRSHGDDIGKVLVERGINQERKVRDKILKNQTL